MIHRELAERYDVTSVGPAGTITEHPAVTAVTRSASQLLDDG